MNGDVLIVGVHDIWGGWGHFASRSLLPLIPYWGGGGAVLQGRGSPTYATILSVCFFIRTSLSLDTL